MRSSVAVFTPSAVKVERKPTPSSTHSRGAAEHQPIFSSTGVRIALRSAPDVATSKDDKKTDTRSRSVLSHDGIRLTILSATTGAEGASAGRPRWRGIFSITGGASMAANNRSCPPQSGHVWRSGDRRDRDRIDDPHRPPPTVQEPQQVDRAKHANPDGD